MLRQHAPEPVTSLGAVTGSPRSQLRTNGARLARRVTTLIADSAPDRLAVTVIRVFARSRVFDATAPTDNTTTLKIDPLQLLARARTGQRRVDPGRRREPDRRTGADRARPRTGPAAGGLPDDRRRRLGARQRPARARRPAAEPRGEHGHRRGRIRADRLEPTAPTPPGPGRGAGHHGAAGRPRAVPPRHAPPSGRDGSGTRHDDPLPALAGGRRELRVRARSRGGGSATDAWLRRPAAAGTRAAPGTPRHATWFSRCRPAPPAAGFRAGCPGSAVWRWGATG